MAMITTQRGRAPDKGSTHRRTDPKAAPARAASPIQGDLETRAAAVRLGRYRCESDPPRANCHYSALNFFAREPDAWHALRATTPVGSCCAAWTACRCAPRGESMGTPSNRYLIASRLTHGNPDARIRAKMPFGL